MGHLQIRQGSVKRHLTDPHLCWIEWGPWVNVPSAGWLMGYFIANSDLVYEFRNEPRV